MAATICNGSISSFCSAWRHNNPNLRPIKIDTSSPLLVRFHPLLFPVIHRKEALIMAAHNKLSLIMSATTVIAPRFWLNAA